MSKHKPIPKKTRIELHRKFNQKCAYCGCDLEYKDMQVDHVKSVYANTDIKQLMSEQEMYNISNLLPACRLIFFACLKLVIYIILGKNIYLEFKILDKKAHSWKRFKKYGVSGFITTNIFAEISSANGYIEASCSNIKLPDYYYKRFSFDKDGYDAAFNWITEKGKYMSMSRTFSVGEDGNLKSLYPQTYEWNQELLKNEPCLFGIEVDLEN